VSTTKVYFADIRASAKENFLSKIVRLMDMIDLKDLVPPRSLVAVKVHFGERGNTGFLRPILISRIVERIKELGASPFLTDTNTLYVGTRGDSVSHIETAIRNGFAYAVVDAPIIIADGMRGASSKSLRINQEIIKTAHIGKEIAESDVLISAAHFKGHDLAGFGGTIKNLGMGCASRKGKLVQHSEISPKVKRKKCIGCGDCIEYCAQSAISLNNEKAMIDPQRCVGCGECIHICPNRAINVQWNQDIPLFHKKMVEYTLAVLKDKKGRTAFLNFLTQISPSCDCCSHSDAPIVQDLGIMASTDPVAIDQASVDMVNRQRASENSCLSSHEGAVEDKFRAIYPKVDWSIQLDHAEKIGLGNRTYELVTI